MKCFVTLNEIPEMLLFVVWLQRWIIMKYEAGGYLGAMKAFNMTEVSCYDNKKGDFTD